MEELSALLGNFATLTLVVGGGVSAIAFAFAGFTFLTAQGDPGKLAQAKAGIIGVVGGLGVMGASFIVPNVVSETVIEPAGGVPIRVDAGTNCDKLLKRQLVFQRQASNADHITQLIRQIQAQRDQCAKELWNPTIAHESVNPRGQLVDNSNPFRSERNASWCFGDNWIIAKLHLLENYGAPEDKLLLFHERHAVGGIQVPTGLRMQHDLRSAPQRGSGRDGDNNIIVYWSKQPVERPSDGASCWMYESRLGGWFANHVDP